MLKKEMRSELVNSVVEDFVCEIPLPEMPSNVRMIDDYRLVEVLKWTSCHQVSKYQQVDGDEIQLYFFKANIPGSVGPALEAISAGFSALIAPEYTAKTYPVCDGSARFTGVMSSEIMDFKPSSEDGLEEGDLVPSPLDDVPIPVLEHYYREWRVLQEKLNSLRRKKRKIEADRQNEYRRLEEKIRQPVPESPEQAADFLLASLRQNLLSGMEHDLLFAAAKAEMDAFYDGMAAEYGLSRENFDSYLILRGHAFAFGTAVLNQDADFHRNNFTKYGMRFDFDMTLWQILYGFKKSRLKVFRKHNSHTFRMSAEDVLHFPNLQDAQPFYWPTWTKLFLSGTIFDKIRPYLNFSANAYSERDAQLYSRLEHNRIFKYHKFAVLLRFILTSPEMYRKIVSQNLPDDDPSLSRLIYKIMSVQIGQLTHLHDILVSLPEFRDFFCESGDKVLADFVSTLQADAAKQIHENFMVLQNQINSYDRPSLEVNPALDIRPVTPDSEIDGEWLCLSVEEKDEGLIDSPEQDEVLDIHDIKRMVIEEMEEYISDGGYSIMRMFGLFRHHIPQAREIIAFCGSEEMRTSNDPQQNITASKHLYRFLTAKLNVIPAGLMKSILADLIAEMEASLEFGQELPFAPQT